MLPSRIYHRQWSHHRLLFRDHRWILLLNVLRCLLRIRLVLQGMVLQMYYLRSVECCVHERSLLLSRCLQRLSLDFLMFRWIIILCYLGLLLLLHLHWKCLRMLFRFRNLVMYALRSCMFHRKYFSLQLRDLLLLWYSQLRMWSLLLQMLLLMLQLHLLVLRFSVQKHLLLGLLIFRRCYLHLQVRNELLHDHNFWIHKMMSGK